MIYFATPSTPLIRRAIDAGVLACMAGPRQGNVIRPGWVWAADNDRFRAGEWRRDDWLRFLDRNTGQLDGCLFAAVPDTVGDWQATRDQWDQYAPEVTSRGYCAAYVAQDGAEDWPTGARVLFMGGTTAWKCGRDAWGLAMRAQRAGLWVHWGRVNSRRRFAMAALDGDSADGTFLRFGPDRNLPELVGWLNTFPFPKRGTEN